MPKRPVVARVANCASVSTGPRKAAAIFRSSLTRPGRFGLPDVVLACEAADFDATLEAEKCAWEAVQFTESSATAGSAVAWNPEVAWPLGSAELLPGTPAGEGIRARSLVWQRLNVHGHRAPFVAGHAPPDRAPKNQQSFLDRLRLYRGVIGLDSNRRPREIEQMGYHREYLGVELLGVFVPRWIPTSRPRAVDVGSDHPAVDVRLWVDASNNPPRQRRK